MCAKWQWNALDWCYWIALPASPVVQSSNTVSCVSLSFRTHPCVLAIVLFTKFQINTTYIWHTTICEYILCCLQSSRSTPLIYDISPYASISCVVYKVPDQHHLYMTYHHMRVYLVLSTKFQINTTYIWHTTICEYILCCLQSSRSTPLIYDIPPYASISCVVYKVPDQHHLYMTYHHMRVYLVLSTKFQINTTYIWHTTICEYILCCLQSSRSTPLIYDIPPYASISCVASEVPYQQHLYKTHQHMGVWEYILCCLRSSISTPFIYGTPAYGSVSCVALWHTDHPKTMNTVCALLWLLSTLLISFAFT